MTYESAEVSGMPTLLRDGQPVAYLDGAMLHVSPWFAEQGFGLLTRVLAPDEATIERLARVVTGRDGHDWPLVHPHARSAYLEYVRLVLAALAGTSAQARHTDDDTTGGGEHG